MISTLKFLLRAQRKCQQPPQKDQGFTLIELLVSMILAVLVIGPLLAFMLNILETDRREQAKSISEQEVQQALDYITQDVAQAVYIYDADGLTKASTSDSTTSGIKDQIPPGSGAVGNCPSTATCTPVLVFWKREFLPDVVPVTSGGATVGYDDTYVYSLVAYYLVRDNSSLCLRRQESLDFKFRMESGTLPTLAAQQVLTIYLGIRQATGFSYLT